MTRQAKFIGAVSLVVALSIGIGTASAWIPNGNVTTISNVLHWQDDSPHVVIVTALGDHCYFNATTTAGKNLLSVVMGYFLSARKVRLYCHDATSNIGGINAHLVHRIGAE